MKLRLEQAETLESFLAGEGWSIINEFMEERLSAKYRALATGKLDPDEYVRTCAAIRELEYLRDEPIRLVRKSYMETRHA